MENSAENQEIYKSWLDDRELTTLAKYTTAAARSAYLLAHASLHFVLGEVTGKYPSDIRFGHNAWGRPELPGGPHFSLSHSRDWVIVAIDQESEIGVDFEAQKRRAMPPLKDWLLSQVERRAWSDLSEIDLSILMRVWVRKEAVLKALGRGFYLDPKLVTVGIGVAEFDSAKICEFSPELDLASTSFIDVNLPFVSHAAVARMNKSINAPKIHKLQIAI